jgi:hypothetical protein
MNKLNGGHVEVMIQTKVLHLELSANADLSQL